MCLVTVLVAVRPRLRAKYAWWTFAGDLAAIALCYVDRPRAGAAAGPPGRQPGAPAARRAWAAADLVRDSALAVAALVVALVKDRAARSPQGASVLTAIAAVLLVVWTVRVGHAGAEAVWSGLPSKKS